MQLSRVMFFICLLIATAPCYAQGSKTEIIYTGRLMGYFRSPARQSWNPARGCKESGKNSDAAIEFQKLRNAKPNAVLVGTGDNFAPELEARMFYKDTDSPVGIPLGAYTPGNKELYYWHEAKGSWVYYEELKKKEYHDLEDQLAAGNGTIPTDNVGCFLAVNRFAAIVPGKHDFYFGVERVRELARFMASLTMKDVPHVQTMVLPEGQLPPPYQPPQMLGANLIIKTSRTDAGAGSAGKPKSKWEGSSVKLGDGKSIYPWFASTVTVKIPSPDSESVKKAIEALFASQPNPSLDEVAKFIKANPIPKLKGEAKDAWDKLPTIIQDLKTIKVCRAKENNEIAAGCPDGWEVDPLRDDQGHLKAVSANENSITYSFTLHPNSTHDWSKTKKGPVFEPGASYGLCQMTDKSAQDEIETKCQTFSVNRPFLSLPRDGKPHPEYKDPDPFVLIPDRLQPEREVAIFGVVDPSITQYIGVLNYSWMYKDNTTIKSTLSVEEPLEALREQLDYFDAWYKFANPGKEFKGMKVLLAQMSPHIARKLAARLNRFQMVVTEADEELATSDTTLTTEWNAKAHSSAFVAVPAPYYQTSGLKENEEGKVHFGAVKAENKAAGVWKLDSILTDPASVPSDANTSDKKAYASDAELAETLWPGAKRCHDSEFDKDPDRPTKVDDIIRMATLCAMRERLSADVALIQKRDLFSRVPHHLTDVQPPDIQQILDYLIWKGDLLTLLYVPGSALKSALEASAKYDKDDANNLSLADEKQRGLAYLGIVSRDKEFLINEQPIDEKKIYSVATTDYIAGGDTGYPELTKALDAKTQPSQYPAQLESISGLVCARIKAADSKALCLAATTRDEYLDQITVNNPPPALGGPGFGSKLWKLFPFKLGGKDQKEATLSGFSNQQVEQRGFWVLSLKNFGVSFDGLSNNLSDDDIATKFAGVKASGVTAHKAQTIGTALDLRLFRASHTGGPFATTTIDYRRQSTGDIDPEISQKANVVTGEAGYLRNLRGGNSDKSMGLSFSAYSETQLQRPFSNFGLGAGDSIKISQNRSLMLLPRIGLFWRYGVANAFSAGFQAGREFRALVGYSFDTPAGPVKCEPEVVRTFAKCIKDNTPKSNPITANSASAILDNRPRAGFYWNSGFTVPINSKMSYVFTDKGNYFFNFSGDNATDTRYRDESKHSLKFTIWPSFSIGPSLRLLLYRNKVNKDFLFQKEFGFETSFAFDLFNRREKEVQIKHKP